MVNFPKVYLSGCSKTFDSNDTNSWVFKIESQHLSKICKIEDRQLWGTRGQHSSTIRAGEEWSKTHIQLASWSTSRLTISGIDFNDPFIPSIYKANFLYHSPNSGFKWRSFGVWFTLHNIWTFWKGIMVVIRIIAITYSNNHYTKSQFVRHLL